MCMTAPDYPGPANTLAERIEGIPVAMMTTVGDDLRMHSRPMATQQTASDDGLWFFTSASSQVAQHIQRRPSVNLSYVDLPAHRYISVVGTARLVRDSARIRALWSQAIAKWFPKGADDPDITLIHVDVEEADYWDDSTSTFVRLSGFIRHLLGDKAPPLVDRGHLDMHPT